MSRLTKTAYHGFTSVIKAYPLHPSCWLTRANFFLDQYPILAVADAYKAYLLAQSDFINLEKYRSRITERNLQKYRNEARITLVRALLALHAVNDASIYLREFEGTGYSHVIGKLAEEVRRMNLEVSLTGRTPKFERKKYPWMAERHVSRSPETLGETRKQLNRYGLELSQSTITNDPQVFGLFAKKKFRGEGPIANDLQCQIVKLTKGDRKKDVHTTYVQRLLKEHIRNSSQSSQTDHLLDEATISVLTAGYHGVEDFSMKQHVVEIFEILRPRFHIYEETFDFWVIMTVWNRIMTNCFGRKDYEGIQPLFSFFNHSCDPNTLWDLTYPPNRMQLSTLKTVFKDEELFVSYLSSDDLRKPVHSRRQLLTQWIDGDCMCSRCKAEALGDKKRKRIGTDERWIKKPRSDNVSG
jgi:hypothetical protein